MWTPNKLYLIFLIISYFLISYFLYYFLLILVLIFYLIFRSYGAYENPKLSFKIVLKLTSEVSEDIILAAKSYNIETLIHWVFMVFKRFTFI